MGNFKPEESTCVVDDLSNVGRLPQDSFISGLTPLVTKHELRSYCEQMVALGYSGAERALKALDYIVEGCSSPMESTLCTLMVLPVSEGGYGIPLPRAGYVVSLPEGLQSVLGERSVRCDLCWPEKKVVLEYDGEQFHTGEPGPRRDPMRSVVLGCLGYTVVPVTRGRILNIKSFDTMMRKLSKALGVGYAWPSNAELDKKREVRRELFGI